MFKAVQPRLQGGGGGRGGGGEGGEGGAGTHTGQAGADLGGVVGFGNSFASAKITVADLRKQTLFIESRLIYGF